MHRLLRQQVDRFLADLPVDEPKFRAFLERMDSAYRAIESERTKLERSLKAASRESLSEKARTHEKLERSLSLVRAAFESTADGMLVVNREGAIVDSNRQFAEMWRIPRDILDSKDDDRALAFVLDQLV